MLVWHDGHIFVAQLTMARKETMDTHTYAGKMIVFFNIFLYFSFVCLSHFTTLTWSWCDTLVTSKLYYSIMSLEMLYLICLRKDLELFDCCWATITKAKRLVMIVIIVPSLYFIPNKKRDHKLSIRNEAQVWLFSNRFDYLWPLPSLTLRNDHNNVQ